jgi:hypothetical protein
LDSRAARGTGLPGALARLQRSNFGACRICVMEIPASTIKLGAMATRGFTPRNLIESLQLLGPKKRLRSLSVILFFAAERPRALRRLPHAVENLPEWVHYLVKKSAALRWAKERRGITSAMLQSFSLPWKSHPSFLCFHNI